MNSGKTNLASFNNNWYNHGASSLKLGLWQLTSGLFFINHFSFFSGLKVTLLRIFGAKVGKGVVIKQAVKIKYPWLLEIGNHVWIGEEVWIENHANVIIGDNSCISQGGMLLCGNHNYKKSSFDLIAEPITLEDGVWIGAHAVVCPGTICKSHAVVTVNSVANGTLDAYSIYRGNPAEKIRTRVIS
jgi:putative colanic acid biosynthesis acetyltransferase WcaF